MEKLAYIANGLLLVVVFWNFATKGPPSTDEATLVFLVIASPIVSVLALVQSGKPRKESLVHLWLERMRLEQKARVDALKNDAAGF